MKGNLWNCDPVAYAFLKALTLTEEQVSDLQETINERGGRAAGGREDLGAGQPRDVVQLGIDAAE